MAHVRAADQYRNHWCRDAWLKLPHDDRRIRNSEWSIRPTPEKRWPSERAYPAELIREVFLANPETAPYVPVQI